MISLRRRAISNVLSASGVLVVQIRLLPLEVSDVVSQQKHTLAANNVSGHNRALQSSVNY